jgi:N-acetyl-gamma-glutamyl-phosphate reductase
MLVSIPLHLDFLPSEPTSAEIEASLSRRYAGNQFVRVIPARDIAKEGGKLEPESLNNTNVMELRVIANDERRHVVLVAKLDNLGKGASGAAVQNLELMLGL